MLTPTTLSVLANAILRGEQEQGAIAYRVRDVLGRDWQWIGLLSGRYVANFAGRLRPRRREVIRFLQADQGFIEACRKHGHQLKIKRSFIGAQPMLPVPAAQHWDIPPIETLGALAEKLGVTPSELGWFADLKGLGYKRSEPRLDHYHYHVLTKSTGGIRMVECPKPRLKNIQRQILSSILDHVPAHAAAHGFVKGRSIHTFASAHIGQRVVLRMDLENFFPSFPGARIQSFFRTMGYPEPVADVLGGLATNCVPQRIWRDLIKPNGDPENFWHIPKVYARPHLPQGAPTSPALANHCCYGHPEFRQHLQGRISFIESVNVAKGKRLRAIFDRIAWD